MTKSPSWQIRTFRFLTAVEITLLKEVSWRWHFQPSNKKTREIHKVLRKLKKYGSVCVPTDTNNTTQVIQIKDYKGWVSEQLLKTAKLSLRPKAMALFEEAIGLIEEVKMDLSVHEEKIVRHLLSTQAIPSPKFSSNTTIKTNEKG